ncbi:MAG: MTH938/NDUFAF3 family protein [Steroidobacteraceae bacterium]
MLTLDRTEPPNLIRSYAPDEIRLATRTLHTSCLVTARDIVAPWGPTRMAALRVEDLEPVFVLGATIVLLAAAGAVEFPDAAIRRACSARRVGLEVMEFGAACRTFNVLLQEERGVALALILAAV